MNRRVSDEVPLSIFAPPGCWKKSRTHNAKEMHVESCMAARRGSLSGDVGDDVGGGCSCGLQGAHAVLCRFSAVVSWLELLIDFGSAIIFSRMCWKSPIWGLSVFHIGALVTSFFHGLLH